jgi:hypothetical protein
MTDDVLINKAAVIERCVHRACEAALDMGQHWVRTARLGVPPTSNGWWLFETLPYTMTKAS